MCFINKCEKDGLIWNRGNVNKLFYIYLLYYIKNVCVFYYIFITIIEFKIYTLHIFIVTYFWIETICSLFRFYIGIFKVYIDTEVILSHKWIINDVIYRNCFIS